MVKVNRVYDSPSRADGLRVLVDDCGRKWFGHDTSKWKQFEARNPTELRDKKESITVLNEKSKKRTLTLLLQSRKWR